jgi:homoserine dehydrogenase
MTLRRIGIGIVGLGTVGLGTAKILLKERERLKKQTGVDCELVQVADIRDDLQKVLPTLPESVFIKDFRLMVQNPAVDVVVELIGGTTAAKEVILAALRAKKHVVTANKALLAQAGDEVFAAAKESGRVVAFEAAVCGGIPVIRALKEGLPANRIQSIYGILNGTANFILTKMRFEHRDFASALKEAQRRGFAEQDPSYDVEGVDSVHKLSILASLGFGKFYSCKDVHVEGITHLTELDIQYADDMGFCIKLLALARMTDKNAPYLSVAPTLIPKNTILAGVNHEYNGVVIQGDSTGHVLFTGKGAGGAPTGSAVVSDILHIAQYGELEKDHCTLSRENERGEALSIDQFETEFYVRLKALDRPGVMSKVSGVFGAENISIAGLVQKENTKEGNAVIVIRTHKTLFQNVRKALEQVNALDIVTEKAVPIRIFSQII